MSLDRLDRPGAAAADAADHLVGVGADGAPREFGRVRETRRHPVAMRLDRLDDRILRGLNAFDQIVAPLAQARQQVVADRLEAVVDFPDARQDLAGGLLAGVGKAFGRGFRRSAAIDTLIRAPSATMRSSVADPVPVHRHGDVVRRRPERSSQPLAGFGRGARSNCRRRSRGPR